MTRLKPLRQHDRDFGDQCPVGTTPNQAAASPAVVNTSSLAAVVGIGSSVAYAASKGALSTMTLSLARALAPRIRVNAICPGFIDTPWLDKLATPENIQALRETIIDAIPLRVLSTGDDIAGAALFLASDLARHITGESLMVDAGCILVSHRQKRVRL